MPSAHPYHSRHRSPAPHHGPGERAAQSFLGAGHWPWTVRSLEGIHPPVPLPGIHPLIGWTPKQRQNRLHLIANNVRFLILPGDWNRRYGYRPVLLETFVESNRFHGTCYQGANWIYVGCTTGRGKLDVHNTASLPQKGIWLCPLTPDFKQVLRSP